MQTEEIPGYAGEHIMHAVIGAASAIDHVCGDRVEIQQSMWTRSKRGGSEGNEESAMEPYNDKA